MSNIHHVPWLALVARPLYACTQMHSLFGRVNPELDEDGKPKEAPGLFRMTIGEARRQMQHVIDSATKPEDIELAMAASGINWVIDPKVRLLGWAFYMEYARAPSSTWALGHGDCEDLMLLSSHLLRGVVHKCVHEYWAVKGPDGWHAVLVFPWRSQWGLFDNGCVSYFMTKEGAITGSFKSRTKCAWRM